MIVPEVVRGEIIRILHAVHPRCLAERLLLAELSMLRVSVLPVALASECSYLRDKGYIESEERKTPGTIREKYFSHRLTAKGKDLYEGHLDDPAVVIG